MQPNFIIPLERIYYNQFINNIKIFRIMKKYLMTGVAALAICAAFTSCSKNEELYNPEQIKQNEAAQIQESYNKAFIATFGQPAANQDWGFGSSAKTRGAMTRGGSEPDQTVWPNYGYPTKPGTLLATTPSGKSEEEIVTEWFQTHTIADAVTLDCNDYWVLQVHYKNYEYTANQHEWEKYENGKEVWKTGTQKVNPLGHMDQIFANTDANGTSSDHIYNFNTGSGNYMLVLNSETQYGFGYEESWGTDNKHVYNRSFMAHIVDEANGIDGYYVGFDYQAYKLENVQYTNSNGETISYPNNKAWAYEPDGVYDDRIIKIVPGTDITTGYDLRIIAEDLNAKAEDSEAAKDGIEDSDWDFNDAVFDVRYTSESTAMVKIVGAGGILPLYVANHEVHEALGQSGPDKDGYYKIQNSGTSEEFEVTGINKSKRGSDIPVFVKRPTTSGGDVTLELKAPVGQPAAKICVKPTFKVCAERQDIRKKYPLFTKWVQDSNQIWYYDEN